jgi:hypothetical protein
MGARATEFFDGLKGNTMPHGYSDYQPLLLLDSASLATFKSTEYHQFVCDAAIVPGIRLLLHRHRAQRDWPYVDTKFNPNTGQDLPESAYDVVFSWFLGRGTQALDGHLPWLDRLESLTNRERDETRALFGTLVGNMAGAISEITKKNNGRSPFRVNRNLEAIDEQGHRIEIDAGATGAGDIFCGKGLIAEGSEACIRSGLDMLLRSAEAIRQNRVGVEQFTEQPRDISHGSKMLMQDAVQLVFRKTGDAQARAQILEMSADFIAGVLDLHYDAESATFSEYIDAETKERKSHLDPGHANELVGLGLGALQCMKADVANLTDARRKLVDRACIEMPRLLIKSTELGWNDIHPGLYKAVDNKSGEAINDEMPWWNLPETMRAAVRAYEVTRDDPTRTQCLDVLRKCHNAYFEHYLNRDNMLFPFQTISGATGKVVDKVPAVPEGDPLYHTNLALLEMLEVLERL